MSIKVILLIVVYCIFVIFIIKFFKVATKNQNNIEEKREIEKVIQKIDNKE